MSAPQCVDLRALVKGRYRITYDEAYDHKGKHRQNLDPWYMQIPCHYGTIYPHGGSTLALEIDHHNQTAKRIAALPCVVVHQSGDFEKTLLFDVEMFDQVAEIVKPRKRRILTDEQKAASAARFAAYRSSKPT